MFAKQAICVKEISGFSLSAISFSLSLFVVDISFREKESNWGYFNLVFAFDNNTFFYLKKRLEEK